MFSPTPGSAPMPTPVTDHLMIPTTLSLRVWKILIERLESPMLVRRADSLIMLTTCGTANRPIIIGTHGRPVIRSMLP